MEKLFLTSILCLSLSACTLFPPRTGGFGDALDSDVVRPKPRPSSFAPLPSDNAITVEEFDTTSSADRAAASETGATSDAEQSLGETIATLGAPAKPGFWLETPLVTQRRPGRVVAVANGESVLVDLLPIEGPDGAGSRLSLAALRLLGVGLTGLHELQVFGR